MYLCRSIDGKCLSLNFDSFCLVSVFSNATYIKCYISMFFQVGGFYLFLHSTRFVLYDFLLTKPDTGKRKGEGLIQLVIIQANFMKT
jgi:hypothetical protein